jgi:hypothetical protein
MKRKYGLLRNALSMKGLQYYSSLELFMGRLRKPTTLKVADGNARVQILGPRKVERLVIATP